MKTLRLVTITFLLVSLLINPGREVEAERAGTYRYVIPGDSLTSTSCTREDPCELSYAFYMANPGDIIIVHSGLYTPHIMGDDFLIIDKSLILLGSCTFDASTPYECHPDQRNSSFDAEHTKRVIRVEGISGDEQVHIEGFTIQNGYGVGMLPCYASFNGCGGGIHASNLNNLTLKNNTLIGNLAGNSSGAGGALFAYDIDYLIVDNNSLIFNQATMTSLAAGGAAFVAESGGPNAVVFSNNLIVGNESNTDNTPSSAGGGILVTLSNNVQIRNNRFEYQNIVQQNADLRGSSLYFNKISGFSVEENIFIGNYGSSATLIRNDSDGQISQNKWWNNDNVYNLELDGDVQVDIYNNFFGKQMPSTMSRGGGTINIYLHSDSFPGYNDISILFNTIAAASAGIDVGDFSEVQIINNIFTGLNDSINYSGTIITSNIINNLFYNNLINDHLGTDPVFADPKLVDIASGDFHLLPSSGAIDRTICGDFDEDIEGDFRPAGSGPTPCDIGADEFYYEIWLPLILR